MQRVYLDHNATSPLLPEAGHAMRSYLEDAPGNASSVHWHGRRARAALEEARNAVARLVAADPSGVVFTGGATEANNMAIRGAMDAAGGGHLLISSVEHPSVAVPCDWLAGRGASITRLRVDGDGRVDGGDLEEALRPDTRLVSVMLANHETGVIQPLRAVCDVARRAGIPVHTDAVQAAGRIPVDVTALGVDMVSLSAHKLGGPPGVGILWVRPGTRLEPLVPGGGQESDRRGGTENVPGAVGFGVAARAASERVRRQDQRVRILRDRLESGLLAAWPGARVHGHRVARLPNTTCVGFPGLDGEAAVMRLDLEGVAVSLGSACAAGSLRPSPVLSAMGVPEPLTRASLRFSLGTATTAEEIERTIHVFEHCVAATGAVAAVGEGA